MTMRVDDPTLDARGPGEEFALAFARAGKEACLTLRAAISDRFPPAKRRPRHTVRNLLRKAVVDSEHFAVATFAERARDVSDDDATPEFGFGVASLEVPIGFVTAAVPVPPAVLDDPAAIAAFIDFRLLVRLGTAENEALLNGDGSQGITGLLRAEGLRHLDEPAGSVGQTLLRAAAECEWYGGSADGMVVHPDDWWPLVESGLLERLATWGVTISRTRVLPAGTALVGDFTAAATILDARTSTIRFGQPGEYDADGPVLVAEIREGLAVHLPGHFVLAPLPGECRRSQ